jgi:hypothetical protein
MLNDKALACVELATATSAMDQLDDTCPCDVDAKCEACVSAFNRYEKALVAFREDEGEPGEARERIANKRSHDLQKIQIGGQTMYIGVGEYPDGRLSEVWVDISKEGAPLRSIFDSMAVAVSLGLQYGVPLQEFIDAFLHTNFEPNGPVQGHPEIKTSSSFIDVLFRHLAIEYKCKLRDAPVSLT